MATRFRFGVDVDNVLANSSQRALDLLNERRGNFPSFGPINRNEITHRPFFKSDGFIKREVTNDEVSAVLDEAWRTDHRKIPLIDQNIPYVISSLRKNGVSIEIITTMGARDPSIQPNLTDWLNFHGIEFDGGKPNFVKGSPEKIAFPVHTIVDDEQELAKSLADTGRPGLVYDAPWNRAFVTQHLKDQNCNRLIIPVKDWAQTGTEVLNLMENLRH